jgi:hypothetical protein
MIYSKFPLLGNIAYHGHGRSRSPHDATTLDQTSTGRRFHNEMRRPGNRRRSVSGNKWHCSTMLTPVQHIVIFFSFEVYEHSKSMVLYYQVQRYSHCVRTQRDSPNNPNP